MPNIGPAEMIIIAGICCLGMLPVVAIGGVVLWLVTRSRPSPPKDG